MSSSSLRRSSGESEGMGHVTDPDGEQDGSAVRITVIVQDRFSFESRLVTGAQIKERAHVPAGFALYRRGQTGNEAIPDAAEVELRDGDHFFARPSSSS